MLSGWMGAPLKVGSSQISIVVLGMEIRLDFESLNGMRINLYVIFFRICLLRRLTRKL
jgi:hypothetical protein